ncbi:MAG: hypothetical protein NZT92_22300, partial [Abditibacteriales bacterium]|nr:hypothetical protein [Abditibacteriales bacterium]
MAGTVGWLGGLGGQVVHRRQSAVFHKRWTFLMLLFCLSPLWAEEDLPPDEPPPPERTEAPAPTVPASEEEHVFLRADRVTSDMRNRLSFQGNVRVTYRDTVITADRADVDLDASIAYISGSVLVRDKTGETIAEAIEFDLRHRLWSFTHARMTFLPNPQIGTVAPFFAEVQKGEVSP